MEKIKLFTDSDLDGIGCAVIAMQAYQLAVEIEYCTAKNINDRLTKFINCNEFINYKKVFITDLVITDEVAKNIDECNKQNKYLFKMFDHHRSNFINKKYNWTMIVDKHNDRNTCGSELFWNYIEEYQGDNITDDTATKINELVEYIRLWDTWDWDDAGATGIYAKNLNTLLYTYGRNRFISNMNRCIHNPEYSFISPMDESILKLENYKKNKYISQKLNNVYCVNYQDKVIGVVFAENNVSEIANEILKTMDNIDFAAVINPDSKGVSLRARNNDSVINLVELAQSFGGGGHATSAGFMYDRDINVSLIKSIFKI